MPTRAEITKYQLVYQKKVEALSDDELIVLAIGSNKDPDYIRERQRIFKETKARIQKHLKLIPKNGNGYKE